MDTKEVQTVRNPGGKGWVNQLDGAQVGDVYDDEQTAREAAAKVMRSRGTAPPAQEDAGATSDTQERGDAKARRDRDASTPRR